MKKHRSPYPAKKLRNKGECKKFYQILTNINKLGNYITTI